MTQTTPAATLRAAADKLRKLIAAVACDIAANPYWGSDEYPPHDYPNLYARRVDNAMGGPAGSFAATMHPGVGLALAGWLDKEAELWDRITNAATQCEPQGLKITVGLSTHTEALAVARQILGSDQ